jgi:hypothetical protein
MKTVTILSEIKAFKVIREKNSRQINIGIVVAIYGLLTSFPDKNKKGGKDSLGVWDRSVSCPL